MLGTRGGVWAPGVWPKRACRGREEADRRALPTLWGRQAQARTGLPSWALRRWARYGHGRQAWRAHSLRCRSPARGFRLAPLFSAPAVWGACEAAREARV